MSDASKTVKELLEEGEGYESIKNYEAAVRAYELAAGRGDAEAQSRLSVILYCGLGGVPQDKEKADKFWQLAMAQEYAGAWYNFAVMYAGGLGNVEKDEKRAIEYLEEAAKRGHAGAQHDLGAVYLKGDLGVEKDKKRAIEYLEEAAKCGHAGAQYYLGIVYARGVGGVESDGNRAKEYFEQAAAQNHPGAREILRKAHEPKPDASISQLFALPTAVVNAGSGSAESALPSQEPSSGLMMQFLHTVVAHRTEIATVGVVVALLAASATVFVLTGGLGIACLVAAAATGVALSAALVRFGYFGGSKSPSEFVGYMPNEIFLSF